RSPLRPHMRSLTAWSSSLVGIALLFSSSSAFAREPRSSEDEGAPIARDRDDEIGTRPAQAAAAPPLADSTSALDSDHRSRLVLASEPPVDWAVLHAGLRPHLGTYGGIATFAFARARTESFYGVLSLSAIRNDAGTHFGAAQIALGRNLADTFAGVGQV